MSQPFTESRIQIIENLFRQYPDIPQETIITHDLKKLGIRFSESALDAMAGTHNLAPMAAMERQEYLKAPFFLFIKGGPYELRPFVLRSVMTVEKPYQVNIIDVLSNRARTLKGIMQATETPYLVDIIDGRFKLLLDVVDIADVGFRPPPFKYYSKCLPDGSAYHDIIYDGLSIVPFSLCQYWGDGEECKFCDLNENARQAGKFKAHTLKSPVLKVEHVEVVANDIAKEVLESEGYPAPIYFSINGGSIITQINGLKEDEFYLRYVEAIKKGGSRRYVRIMINAPDKETLKGYHHRGVDTVCLNLEVWNKRLFEWICPGKAKRVGWEEWVKRTVDAVDIFGEGNVYSYFASGTEMAQPYGFKTINEAVKSNTEGMKFFMSHGVIPKFIPFMPAAGAYLQRKCSQQRVPTEFYLELWRNYYENWKRYQLSVPDLNGSLESKIEKSANFSDIYLLLMDKNEYENSMLQLLEKAGVIWVCNTIDISA